MIKLSPDLLTTKLETIQPDKYKEAFAKAIEVSHWLINRNAYGLAANQVNIPYRFFVIHKPKQLKMPTDVYFNPRYEAIDTESMVSQEFCLSYPGRHFQCLRFPSIKLYYYDPREKKDCVIELKDLPAIIAQHETDHLQGITDEQKQAEFLAFAEKNPDKVKI
jgi:peptide deformylase